MSLRMVFSVRRFVLFFLVLVLCCLVVGVGSAGARLVAAELPFSLKPVGSPNVIAVDQATGNVYVSDLLNNTVKVFGKEGGAPADGVPSEITGGETPDKEFDFGGNAEPAGVAVDGSGGVNAEDVYVADTKHRALDKFKLSGGKYEYVCQFKGYGNKATGDGCLPNKTKEETSPEQPFGGEGVGGTAVDSHGNVYASDLSAHMVYEFNAAGEDVSETIIPGSEPTGLAVDSNGVVYVQDFAGSVYELTPKSPTEFEVTLLDAEGSSYAVAVDPSTNDVYVDHDNYIVERESSKGKAPGAIINELRPSSSLDSIGVAVYGATQDLYVANRETDSVEVFDFVKVPDVRLNGAATAVDLTTATLHGEIDPEGTSEADYYFEYGLAKTLSSSTPEVGIAAVNTFEPASAELNGLEPNTEYGYRLVGTNSSGLLEKSEEGTLKTSPAEPEVTGVQAIDITANSVILSGLINPQNTPPTTYRFEYGETTGYGQRLPQIAIAVSDNPVPVEQALNDLKPETTYHYTLWAENSAGKAPLADHTFTTASEPVLPSTAPAVNTGPATNVAQNTATLTGGVLPEGLPTLYQFEAGTTTAYGTVIFGGQAGSEQDTVAVMQTLAGLQPDTTYHYRLVAFNTAGTTYGADQTFTTPGLPVSLVQPSELPLIATTPIAFPTEPGKTTTTSTKALTNAQKLAKALKACRKQSKKKQAQAKCDKQARRQYGTAKKKRSV